MYYGHMAVKGNLWLTTGTLAFDGGVDSSKPPLYATELMPQGLQANQVAWMGNATCRGGAIRPRCGYDRLAQVATEGLFQGSFLYVPDSGLPYVIAVISGSVYRVNVGTDNSVSAISTAATELNATAPMVWFCQGEEFLVIQDGTNPARVWDGNNLKSILDYATGSAPVLPVGTCMDYCYGHIWVANGGRQYVGGDLVRDTVSGTAAYGYRDSILHMVEAQYFTGGGAFIVPISAGNIRAIKHSANLNTQLGEGQLFIFTENAVFTLDVPTDRTTWQTATDASGSNLPQQRIAQIGYGTQAERSVVVVNGDLFYQSPDGFRSLVTAIRYFNSWGNTAIANNIKRLLDFNDRSLMQYSSGVLFNNRLLELCLPQNTDRGVIFQAVAALDLNPISTLQQKNPPAWEGPLEGLDFFQLLAGSFGGRERCFAITLSRSTRAIEVWELTDYLRFDYGDKRIEWYVEFGAYNYNRPFDLKELDGAEIWIDKLYGTVDFELYYRPDQHPCWFFWNRWQECAARDSCEDVDAPEPCIYPEQTYREQYRAVMAMPSPPAACIDFSGRPSNIGYSFQAKLVIKGWAQLRGFIPHSLPRMKEPSLDMRCAPSE